MVVKINVISNGLEKCIRFNINNKLNFIDSFQIPNSSLNSLIKNLVKDDFKYLSKEFDNNLLDAVKQKGFSAYQYMSKELKNIRKYCLAKKSFIFP